jgi:hypothetical protein
MTISKRECLVTVSAVGVALVGVVAMASPASAGTNSAQGSKAYGSYVITNKFADSFPDPCFWCVTQTLNVSGVSSATYSGPASNVKSLRHTDTFIFNGISVSLNVGTSAGGSVSASGSRADVTNSLGAGSRSITHYYSNIQAQSLQFTSLDRTVLTTYQFGTTFVTLSTSHGVGVG